MRTLLLAALTAMTMLSSVACADFANGTIKIGVLTDLSGPYEGNGGHGSVTGAQIAADEFGDKIDGRRSTSSPPTIRTSPISALRSPAAGSTSTMSTPSPDLVNSGVAVRGAERRPKDNKLLLLPAPVPRFHRQDVRAGQSGAVGL